LKIKIKNTGQFDLPKYQTPESAGADLVASIDEKILLKPLQRVLVPTDIFIELPIGYEAQVRPRSGLALKHGITVLNAPGTIDADFRGEIQVLLINFGEQDFEINPGDRIAQLIIAQFSQAEWQMEETLTETERGAGGYGSTGKQ